jgi:hypothetical protein
MAEHIANDVEGPEQPENRHVEIVVTPPPKPGPNNLQRKGEPAKTPNTLDVPQQSGSVRRACE